MSKIPYYTKYQFLDLMEQKRGVHYTLGWLKAHYALPPTTEEFEMELIQKELPVLEAMPDFEVDAQ